MLSDALEANAPRGSRGLRLVIARSGDAAPSTAGSSPDRGRAKDRTPALAFGRNSASGSGGGGEPAPRITTAPAVGAAPGRVAEKHSSRERTDADERTHDNAAGAPELAERCHEQSVRPDV